MDKLLQMVQSLDVVHTIHQIWHRFVRVTYLMAKNFVPYLLLMPIWLCVVLIFLVWSCVCWGITCVYMTMDIFLKHYLKMIYIPPIKKFSDYPHVLKLKLLYMLTYMVGEIKNSVRYLTSLMTKPKE